MNRLLLGRRIFMNVVRVIGRKLQTSKVIDFPFQTLVEMQTTACKVHKERKVFGTRVGNNFEWITYGEFNLLVGKFRNVLHSHNIGHGDKVAIISNNRVEWAVAMYASISSGAAIVPMYEAQKEKDWQYIVEDSDAKLLIVANDKIYEQTKHFPNKIGQVRSVLSFDSDMEYMHSYKRWMSLVDAERPRDAYYPLPTEIAAIIYTSGTTGNPKGVELTHENLVANIQAGKRLMDCDLNSENVHLTFLPWAHIYGQTSELHGALAVGSSMALVPNKEQIVESIAIVKPTLMMSVPTLFNKIYDGVMKKVEAGSPMKQRIFHYALSISRSRNEKLEFGKPVSAWLNFQHRLADKIVFSKIREVFGGRLRFMCSGGASTTLKVLQFFEDIGIPIIEGYGLTETSPVISASALSWDKRRLGTVGVVYDNLDVKLLDPENQSEVPSGHDGEICVSGPSVMSGYRKNKKANEESFTYIEGKKYFRTGDLGKFVDGKFLKITGRIKEQFKLENGKYVCPVPLEDAICRSRFIAQAMIIGTDKPYTCVLIVPEISELADWASKQNVRGVSLSDPSDPCVRLIEQELSYITRLMKSFERPAKWILVPEPFTPENQMLTPKLSMRRANIMKAYQPLIDDVYAGKAGFTVSNVRVEGPEH